jgi:phosphoglycerate dehydrogenase-like enzyme/glyoxylase-like metal-dependent hydrolase (beta-lactamase superfamily II)
MIAHCRDGPYTANRLTNEIYEGCRMRSGCHFAFITILGLFTAANSARGQGELPPMKFGDVREIAPGVYFRYSAIHATDKSVVFGGSNNIWVVFDDYVLVYDANFPKEAGDVIAAIKQTTDKPIRYVVDSHHHGDHAYGNAVFAKQGATVVAQANCARLLRVDGPKQFADAGTGKTGRKDVAESFLKVPDLIFDEKLVFDDGKQRAELYFFGHAHTAGDAFLYLPKLKILCTGDACTNGPFNYMGHSDSASWVRVLDKAQQLDVKLVCPGHGPLGTKDVLAKQQRFFVELRQQVKQGIDKGLDVEGIVKTIDMPWHKEWTGIEAHERKDAIEYVFDEFIGRTMPWDLVEDFGIYEGPSPTKKSPGWTAPKRIVLEAVMPAKLMELKRIAPEVSFVLVRDAEEAAKEAGDADAVLGFSSAAIVNAGKKLRWIQVGHAGVEKDLPKALIKSDIVLTNTARIYGANVADQGMALLLGLTRGLAAQIHRNPLESPLGIDPAGYWSWAKKNGMAQELHGKTMLIVGLGGIGMQIARRAEAFGMRVMAIDVNESLVRPSYVFSLDPPAKLMDRLPKADVVVLSCPLTEQTRGMFSKAQFAAMKKGALFINVARGGLVNTESLTEALITGTIGGAGLDVTDPEPLNDRQLLWKLPNVIITPHVGGQSPEARDRQWRLYRENVRRFVAGERLLCVVNKEKGY